MIYNEYIADLPLYEPGKPIEEVVREYGIAKEDIIKVASNENPFGCSPKAQIAMANSRPSLYPDDSYYDLKHALASRFGLENSNIIVGSGCDQIMEMAIKAVCNKNRGILHAKTTYAMYNIYAKYVEAPIFSCSSNKHDLDEFKKIYNENKEKIGAIILCLPNNPLGECLDASDVISFIKSVDDDTLIMLDCAYMEFAAYKDEKKSINPVRILEFPNVFYMGTFSKAYGLGGMRVGYGIAAPQIIQMLSRIRPPFNISSASSAAALAALSDEEFVQMSLKNNFDEIQRYENFAREFGLEYIDSYTNFLTILLNESKNSSNLTDNLLKKGIILRNLKSYNLNAVRITIGKPDQNNRVLEELVCEFKGI